ncbi:heptaprenyl diphosphate synthase [Scopulibacillus daqui]|uniref:Heptaprenyl diphosphate synthase n=1 Tax=Scopulibacillus daqui TaxID=1469162 RepID=A0ABS2PZ19_9BACL|nr:heptaprenyl diphosphate synthase component II [Scopulibacillus daqui]MBM7645294.1 heptaprenyl diphosphate synthase [Scopulibacillus daqui]
MSLTRIYKELKRDLNDIEKGIEEAVASDHPTLHQAGYELIKAGGKRIRPILVLLSSRYGKKDDPAVKKAAITLELIHTASLVHDDVIDNAELRRGKPTVKAKWNNRTAMYAGDYLFAKAIDIMADIQNPYANQVVAKAMREMSIGEIEQIKDQFNYRQNLRQYLLRIKRKTALLMAISCELGAIASGASRSIGRKLYYFGYFMGMSYQITDDILDFVGTEKQLGKPAGSDLKQGNITLPTLMAFRHSDIKAAVKRTLDMDNPSAQDFDGVINLIKQSDAIEVSQEISTQYLKKAYNILNDLPDHSSTRSFREIADYIGIRKY